jgi:2-C-methyl-D-erythritol 4-phosphate cytidylyltransferase
VISESAFTEKKTNKQMKKTALIVAGGSGSRMNTVMPKQFLLLDDKPVLCHTIEAFVRADPDFEIIIVLPETHLLEAKSMLQQYFPQRHFITTTGGSSRFASVRNGLQLISENCIVFVHDAVRCLLSPDLITRAYDHALQFGSAIPVIASKDSVRIIDNLQSQALDRNLVRLVQTPQTFQSEILLAAFQQDEKPHFTDEASVVEAMDIPVHLIEGEAHNIKVTFPIDLQLAELLLKK